MYLERKRIVLWLLILAFICGCSSPEAKKAKFLERGNNYFKEKKYREAIIEYINVLKIDSKQGEAYYKLGLCYLKTDKKKNVWS